MSIPIPPSKPKASLAVVTSSANDAWDNANPGTPLPDLYVLAVRGYYRDSMGKQGANDHGIFDDAFFIVSPNGFTAWNGNTDSTRTGWNAGAGKFMARLRTGVWTYRRLKHKMSSPNGYMAFGQGSNVVTVDRVDKDGNVKQIETGCFGINLHRAGINTTSSEGCLTVPQEQWVSFRSTLDEALEKAGKISFPLILIDGPIV